MRDTCPRLHPRQVLAWAGTKSHAPDTGTTCTHHAAVPQPHPASSPQQLYVCSTTCQVPGSQQPRVSRAGWAAWEANVSYRASPKLINSTICACGRYCTPSTPFAFLCRRLGQCDSNGSCMCDMRDICDRSTRTTRVQRIAAGNATCIALRIAWPTVSFPSSALS